MNTDLKPWIAALRSGNYPQTQETLCDNKGFCCLGVAAVVYNVADPDDIRVEEFEDESINEGPKWVYGKLKEMIPDKIYETGMEMNDEGDSFVEIADMIEREMNEIKDSY